LRRVLAAYLGSAALLACPAARAAAEAPPSAAAPASTAGKAAGSAMSTDPSVLTHLLSFLREYNHALAAGNRSFLAEHTVFPLPFAEGVYDMEAKAKERKLATIGDLMKVRQQLRWPQVLVPKTPEDLGRLKRGVQKCDDKKAPDVPDFSKGELAYAVKGDEATLTYLAEPCESETHVVTLTFVRSGASFKLRERAVRMGIE
jgi:hypothetical protein